MKLNGIKAKFFQDWFYRQQIFNGNLLENVCARRKNIAASRFESEQ